ncbi:unnamed protein product, partial [Musa hybrid cultivar]
MSQDCDFGHGNAGGPSGCMEASMVPEEVKMLMTLVGFGRGNPHRYGHLVVAAVGMRCNGMVQAMGIGE